MVRGAGEGRLFREGNYFNYICQRGGGDCLREAINQGTLII